MKIGILGSGNVGGTLGARWAQAGHTVTFSSRTPDSTEIKELVQRAGPNARAATATEAAASDIILIATPWEATQKAIESAGSLAGKIVIDATNPLLPKLAGLVYDNTTSGAEHVAEWAAGATVVKAFNTVGDNVMANPTFGDRPAMMFYCGDDAGAKQAVRQLALDLGFDPQDAGPLRQARLLEPFALLWITLAVFHGYGREIAFSLLRR